MCSSVNHFESYGIKVVVQKNQVLSETQPQIYLLSSETNKIIAVVSVAEVYLARIITNLLIHLF